MKDSFTLMNIISNLTRQWINNDGDFNIDFIKRLIANTHIMNCINHTA